MGKPKPKPPTTQCWLREDGRVLVDPDGGGSLWVADVGMSPSVLVAALEWAVAERERMLRGYSTPKEQHLAAELKRRGDELSDLRATLHRQRNEIRHLKLSEQNLKRDLAGIMQAEGCKPYYKAAAHRARREAASARTRADRVGLEMEELKMAIRDLAAHCGLVEGEGL